MKQRLAALLVGALVFNFFTAPPGLAAQVTSGLLIDLNAANPNSYPGTGTVWSDLVDGDDTATLTNGPTFNTSTGPGFVLDGSNDYVNIPNRIALQPSINTCNTMLLYAKVISATNYDGIMGKMFAASSYDGYALLQSGTNALTLKMNGNAVDQTVASLNNAYSFDTWTLFTFIVCFKGSTTNPSKVYVNNTLVITANNTESGINSPSAPIQLGNGMQDGLEYSNIKIGGFAFYNRALTAQEISDSLDFYSTYTYIAETSTISLASAASGNKGTSITVTASVGAVGKVRFYSNGKRIPGCLNVVVNSGSMQAACTFKPAVSGSIRMSATLTPTNISLGTRSAEKSIVAGRRVSSR